MATTATKADFSAPAGPAILIVAYFMTKIPGWMEMPPEVQGSFLTLMALGVNFCTTYFAPSNKDIIDAHSPVRTEVDA